MTREIGGSGLGLSICKNIIELLGGEITVKSKLGVGFDVLVHASRRCAKTWCAPRRSRAPMRSTGTVLVVDRDPYVADLIETYLVKRGYTVVKAHGADEAMAMAVGVRPGAITLDVILEGTDGFDLLHRLKEAARHQRHPRGRAVHRVRRGSQLPPRGGQLSREAYRPLRGCST